MTNIEWTHMPGFAGESWNPVVGCTHHGAGCLHCYAEALHTQRHKAYIKHGGVYPKNGKPMPAQYAHPFEVVQTMPERLADPLRTRKPTCWFVNSVSDLFHKDVPDEFIAEAFAYMARADWHRYIILTKRAERMRDLLSSESFCDLVDQMDGCAQELLEEVEARAGRFDPNARMHGDARSKDYSIRPNKPLSHVITGVSIANQQDADRLLPILLQTPSACRAVSAEPLIGPVDVALWTTPWKRIHMALDIAGCLKHRSFKGFTEGGQPLHPEKVEAELRARHERGERLFPMDDCPDFNTDTGCPGHKEPSIDWVIVGGESGPGARPCDVAWILRIVDQCKAAAVPCFVKQLGSKPRANFYDDAAQTAVEDRGEEWPMPECWDRINQPHINDDVPYPVRDPKGGDPSEWPQDLRVRQFPEVARG